jgi:hypothetical protein
MCVFEINTKFCKQYNYVFIHGNLQHSCVIYRIKIYIDLQKIENQYNYNLIL